MGTVVLWTTIPAIVLASLAFPWIGVAASYFIGILHPQSIWWWNFEGIRPVYIVTIPTLIGVIIYSMRQNIRWELITNRRMKCLYLLWATGVASAVLSQSPPDPDSPMIRSPAYFMETLSKIILLVTLGSLCIKSERHIKYLTLAFILPSIYLAYWINHKYLSGAAWGRIGGPVAPSGIGNYQDENVFAVVFVALTPFLWFTGLYAKRKVAKAICWSMMLLGWHAIFLTGSRGALLALGAVLITLAWKTKSKLAKIALIASFVVAFAWQAGDTMKERLFTLDKYEEDASATGRLDAWRVGLDMVKSRPLVGVGPGSFLRAFPEYSELKPLQAHNTFVQFAAEFGLIGAFAFIYLLSSSILLLIEKIATQRKFNQSDDENKMLILLSESTLSALIGVTVASFFLTLQLFEITYFLILMSNILISNLIKAKEKN